MLSQLSKIDAAEGKQWGLTVWGEGGIKIHETKATMAKERREDREDEGEILWRMRGKEERKKGEVVLLLLLLSGG